MDLSVIIVNYNVKYFLEQAIRSVQEATSSLQVEIIVVDNASTDGSIEMLSTRFPDVKCIANQHNPGFSIANNQGLTLAQGNHILFLNPDTLVSENTFTTCLQLMKAQPQVGAIGVKMLDGAGQFLPESKRGLPTPRVALFKAIGLHKLFPNSSYFNRYYMGHVGEDEKAEIDVLTGAFFWVRKSILDEIGGFDEDFFMYGEDIDLSYRVQQNGHSIMYLPETSIIHYKGESTKKGSLNYVKHFYQAMVKFSEKHFKSGYSWYIRLLMLIGIYAGASLAILKRMFQRIAWPILDVLLLLGVILTFKNFWAAYYYDDPDYYSLRFYAFNLPIYILTWLSCLWLSGVYDKPYHFNRLLKAMFLGLLLNGLIYGLLSNPYRPSRMIMLVAFVVGTLLMVFSRYLVYYIRHKASLFDSNRKRRVLIVSEGFEAERIKQFTLGLTTKAEIIGYVSDKREGALPHLGADDDIKDIVRTHRVEEIVFSSDYLSAANIMQMMKTLGPELYYKISSSGGGIVGSKSKNSSGEIYTTDLVYQLSLPEYRRLKRIGDILLSIFILACLPLWIFKRSLNSLILSSLFPVIIGSKTWVSYRGGLEDKKDLPDLRPGVWETGIQELSYSSEQSFAINRRYAEKYHPSIDFAQVWYHLFED